MLAKRIKSTRSLCWRRMVIFADANRLGYIGFYGIDHYNHHPSCGTAFFFVGFSLLSFTRTRFLRIRWRISLITAAAKSPLSDLCFFRFGNANKQNLLSNGGFNYFIFSTIIPCACARFIGWWWNGAQVEWNLLNVSRLDCAYLYKFSPEIR